MKCSYCGKEIARGTGKIFVKTDGKILYFHSNKCENNALKLGRDARKFKWTAHFERGTKAKKEEQK